MGSCQVGEKASLTCVTLNYQSDRESAILFEDEEMQIFIVARLKDEPDWKTIDALCQELNKEWKRTFIEWLAKGKSITMSAELAGITPRSAWRALKKDPILARARVLAQRRKNAGHAT